MAWLDRSPEEILKVYNTTQQAHTFPPVPAEGKVQLQSTPQEELDGKKPAIVMEADALSENEFRDLEVYVAQLNPAFMINPQTWMLGATRAMLGMKLDKITATPSISRFYYKLWDILSSLPVIPKEFVCEKSPCMVSATLGEDPGGFTQALIHYRRRFFPDQFDKDKVVGIQTSTERNFSNNEKSFLELYGVNTGKIKIYHSTRNGDLTQATVRDEFIKLFEEEPADLVTGDMCLTMSIKDKKERYATFSRQLLAEVLTTLSIQKKGGQCILKIFLDKSRITADVLHLLRLHYENVMVTKPVTSLLTSSEVYVVCKGFRGIPAKTLKALQGMARAEGEEQVTALFDALPKDAQEQTKAVYEQFYNWQKDLYERGLMVLRERQTGDKETARKEIIKKICINMFYAVDWCVEKDVYLKGQYYLLRSPDRRPYKKEHPCFEALGQTEMKKPE